jgi:hypothetical protein
MNNESFLRNVALIQPPRTYRFGVARGLSLGLIFGGVTTGLAGKFGLAEDVGLLVGIVGSSIYLSTLVAARRANRKAEGI